MCRCSTERLRCGVTQCSASHRQLPVLPSSLSESLAGKTFTYSEDLRFLQYKYAETFSRAVPRITSIDFSHMDVSLSKWQIFIDGVLPLCTGLKALKLDRNHGLAVDVELLMGKCSPGLTSLNLRHTACFGDGPKALAGFLHLEQVDVDDCQISGSESELEAVLPQLCELNMAAHEEARAEAAREAAAAKAKADAEAKAQAEMEVAEMKEIRKKLKVAIEKKVCTNCEPSVVDRVEQELFEAAKGDKTKFVPILKQVIEAVNADEGIKEKLLDERMDVAEVVEWYGDLIS